MGESAYEIERDIASERSRLDRNLHVLESKARELADWRTHYRNHPLLMIGAAFGGAMLLGMLVGGRSRQYGGASDDTWESSPRPAMSNTGENRFARTSERVRHQVGETWDHIADALLGVVSAKAIEFVADRIPGFREQFSTRHPEFDRVFSGDRSFR